VRSSRRSCIQADLRAVVLLLLSALLAAPAAAQPYAARQSGDVVRLEDARAHTSVSILASAGNIVFEMIVNGQNVIYWPAASPDAFKARPTFSGIPFLAPWANRLDEQAFYANGQRYAFDMGLGNVRGANPIHGLVLWTDAWKVVEVRADRSSAWVTSRLEFYRNPLWMKQFPFAHTIDVTHRLQHGILQVTTSIHNLSAEPMPVAIGFHPYFQLTDSPRDEWTISVGARTQWLLAQNLIPTGETQPIERFFPDPASAPLKDYDLDHVFGDLVRAADGRATMSVKGRSQQVDVLLGPNYRAMVIYAPKPSAGPEGSPPRSRNFICFEPMAAITDAMNLAHKGLYKDLQSIPPGGTWQESFWIRPRGF
jgi:aldose 1-epimerase